MPARPYDLLMVRVTITVAFRQALPDCQGVVLGEIGVGLVHHQRPLPFGNECAGRRWRQGGARWRVGIGQERQVGVGVGPGRSAAASRGEGDGLEAGALDLGERAVEEVTRRRRHDQAALGDEGAGQDGQDVVGAVADEDGVGIDAEDAPGRLTKAVPTGSG